MSRVYDFYRTPDQSEIEHEEMLSYLEWYQEQKEKKNKKQKEDENTISDKQ
jgi:hypothetical protein